MTLAEWMVGARVYYVELGATIDSVTVSETAIPDALDAGGDPNWADIGDILEGAQFTKEEVDNSYQKVTTRGWEKQSDKNVIANGINFQTRQMSEIALRLIFGAAAAIVDDTPFAQFAEKDPKIETFLLFQGRQSTGSSRGTDVIRMIQRATLRIGQLPSITTGMMTPSLVAEFKEATPNETVVNPSTDDIIQILADAS
jgi:hypothetical protein